MYVIANIALFRCDAMVFSCTIITWKLFCSFLLNLLHTRFCLYLSTFPEAFFRHAGEFTISADFPDVREMAPQVRLNCHMLDRGSLIKRWLWLDRWLRLLFSDLRFCYHLKEKVVYQKMATSTLTACCCRSEWVARWINRCRRQNF